MQETLYTNEEMQTEYDFLFAEQLTKKLLEMGFISHDEFDKIMAKIKESFSTFLSRNVP